MCIITKILNPRRVTFSEILSLQSLSLKNGISTKNCPIPDNAQNNGTKYSDFLSMILSKTTRNPPIHSRKASPRF